MYCFRILSILSFLGAITLVSELNAQSYTLSTSQAVVVGASAYGEDLHVYADPAPLEMVFNGWTGPDVDKLKHPAEWHTTFRAESSDGIDFAVYPSYDSIGNADFGSRMFAGFSESSTGIFTPTDKRLVYAVPAAERVKAVVFAFHGTNGSTIDWQDRYEQQVILRDLVHAGYAVFAIEADEAEFGDRNGDGALRWLINPTNSDTSTNVDLKNLAALERYAQSFFGDKPVFAYGGSNGANFADFSAALMDYTGVCHMISNGNSWLYDRMSIDVKPAIWIQSRNDQNSSSDSLIAKANYQKLQDRGKATAWHWLDKAPAYPTRFVRNATGLSDTLSRQVYQRLRNQSYLLPTGIVDMTRIKSEFDDANFFNQTPISEAQQADIINQLEILNAEHTPHSDFSKAVIAFFDDLLQGTSTTKESIEKDWMIYPNPAHEKLKIRTEAYSQKSYSLVDMHGTVVKSGKLKTQETTVPLKSLVSGIYIVLVRGPEGFVGAERIVVRGQ